MDSKWKKWNFLGEEMKNGIILGELVRKCVLNIIGRR